MIARSIESQIVSDFGKGKIIAVLGPRQVGKTTLLEQIANGHHAKFYNCDDRDDCDLLTERSSTELASLATGCEMIVIDEAQRVPNIGLTLKKLADLKLPIQVLVSCSSSLELSDEIREAATGRLFEYNLLPLATEELVAHAGDRRIERRMLAQRLVFGSYPEIVSHPSDARRLLSNLSDNYLYKDLLEYRGVRKPNILQKLVRALALQLGSEVSYSELANLVGIDKNTVESYIVLLEKCFVVFRLESYSRNLRNELRKGKKIYFYDNGIRNAVIRNFAPLELRIDVGALWENYMVSERRKYHLYHRTFAQMYFWRSLQQREIDLVEECDGSLQAFEFKWNTAKKARIPLAFANAYPQTPFSVITPDNYLQFLE